MEKDIVPELLETIQKEFDSKFEKSSIVKSKLLALKGKKATHLDSNELAIELGTILSRAFMDNIEKDMLPDGRMYFNIASRIIKPNMKKNYDIIGDYSKEVQDELNRQSKISLEAIKPKINEEKIDNLVSKISDYEDFDEAKWLLNEPIVNFSQSVVDDTVRENAEFQYKSGLEPRIVRKMHGECCDWCATVVGTYKYPDEVPPDVYKRHRYCRCTVEYLPGDGRKQNVHTKKWANLDKDEEIEARKEIDLASRIDSAKKIQKANEFAKAMGFEADYTGIDIKCANEWNKGLYEAKKQFPKVAEQIKFVGSSQKRYSLAKKEIKEHYESYIRENYKEKLLKQGFREKEIETWIKKESTKYANKAVKKLKVDSGEMASSWSCSFSDDLKSDSMHGKVFEILEKYNGITMNNKYFNNNANVVNSGLLQVENKWHPQACFNTKSSFDHEFAHQIDKYLKLSENENILEIYNSMSKEDIKENLSGYAATDIGEFIAEAWSEYCNNENPREVASIVGKEILKLWKKKK